jgi:hypothetical protein
MPYAITTKRPRREGIPVSAADFVIASRRAVATLEEAREECDKIVRLRAKDPDEFERLIWASMALPESGGTVGPLPDGAVIEVAPTAIGDIAEDAFSDRSIDPNPMTWTEIIDAYNARGTI